MIDSFITYESNQGALASPSYFSKHTDDIFKFDFLDNEPCGFLPAENLPKMEYEMPKNNPMDQFSNESAYSTNPSTKHSPEYTPNLEDQGAEEDYYIQANMPELVKKGIKKQYEPIIDNGKVFRYEDSAVEYRKARKRIQNRESASRVRNRKKTHVEELDDQIQALNREKNELKAQNTSLIAENTLLKQQVAFLERMVSRNPDEMIDNTEFSIPDHSRTETSDSILHLMNQPDEDMESQSIGCKYFRVAPSQKFKRHVALLGVFTLLLCAYGLLPRTENGSVQLVALTKHLFTKHNSMAVSIKPDDNSAHIASETKEIIERQKEWEAGGGYWKVAIELVALIGYVVYFIYVAAGAYKRFHKKKAFVYNSLP